MTAPTYPQRFTWTTLEQEYRAVLDAGYRVVTCAGYAVSAAPDRAAKTLINRVDVDLSLKKTGPLLDLYASLGIKASFFIRLHAPEYNPFSHEGYRLIRRMVDEGHELGYHSEVIDVAAIWREDPEKCLRRDLLAMETMFGAKVQGVASHGGMTGLNNLDFWRDRRPAEFGLLYEAYDREAAFGAFEHSFYISDSEWVRWKCYDQGRLRAGDHRSLREHAKDDHPLLYLLIHSDTYHDRHIYE